MDELSTMDDKSEFQSMRWRTLQKSQQVEADYENGKEFANLEGQFTTNSLSNGPHHLRPTSSINEEEDELSKVEKMLSKGQNSWMRRLTTSHDENENDDDDRGVENEDKKVGWVVGEWTECLDSECFNWNTGEWS